MATQTTVKVLTQPVQLTTSSVNQYAAPVNTTTLIKKATVTNTSGVAVNITVYKVPSLGSAGAANTIISAKTIPAGTDVELYSLANHVLQPGDAIFALASAVASLTFALSGIEIV